MKTIAEKTGVSTMTVSRSLRNDPCIPEKTRNRIREAAQELGYIPNPLVSALMSQLKRTHPSPGVCVICYVTNYPEPDSQPWNPLVETTFQGAEKRARELGYQLEYVSLQQPGMTTRRVSRILLNRGIQGLILAPMLHPVSFDFEWEHFACAAIGYSAQLPPLHRAVNDQAYTARLAHQNLRRLGYRRIGLVIMRQDDLRVNRNWTAGFCVEEAYAAGQTEPVEPYRPETLHEPGFKQWLKAQRPDAIITIHDYIKPWVERAGFNVPEDIGIAHLDCNHAGKSVFSGINQHSDLMGKLTLDLVAEQLDKNERGLPDVPKTVIYRGSWVDGGTTRQQPM